MNAPDDSLYRGLGVISAIAALTVYCDRLTKDFWIGVTGGAVGMLLLHLVLWAVRKAKKKNK